MAAIDILITLAIIIKIIDIIVKSYKRKTIYKTPNKIPLPLIIIGTIIMMWLAASLKEAGKNLEQKSQAIANNQTSPTTNNPAGFYMQPLLNVTTGIIENMGKEFQNNAKLTEQKTKEHFLPREIQTSQQQNLIYSKSQLTEQELSKEIEQLKQEILNNPKKINIKKMSHGQVVQAINETQSFNAQYKKPNKCYNIENHATRVKCSNDYMRARAAFDKEQRKN